MSDNVNIVHLKPNVKQEEVLRYLKINISKWDSNAEFNKLIDYYLDYSKALFESVIFFNKFKVASIDSETGTILFDNDKQIISKNLSEFLVESNHIYIVLGTIGNEIDNEINELEQTGKLTDSIIIDAIGSAAIESVVDRINYLLWQEENNRGNKMTKRFSPGYGDLDISYQGTILKLLDNDEMNITVTDSNILIPRKSVSAIIGVIGEGTDANVSCCGNKHLCDSKCAEIMR